MSQEFKPYELQLAVTPRCNNACYFCYSGNGYPGNEISLETLSRITDEFLSFSPFRKVVFTGGEPTARFADILKVMESHECKYPRFGMISNGGLIGAAGEYKERSKVMLEPAGLYHKTPSQAVGELHSRGLDSVNLSVDSTHVTLEEEPGKVPYKSLLRCFDAFLGWGYSDKGGRDLKINSIALPGDQATENILYMLAKDLGFEIDERILVSGDQMIPIMRYAPRKFSAAASKDFETVRLTLENIFSLRCPARIQPTNYELFSTGSWQDSMTVDWAGDAFICADRTVPIGNVHEDSLADIIARVNQGGEDHPIYGRGIRGFQIMDALSTDYSSNNSGLGRCLELVYQTRPDLVEKISGCSEACHALGNNPEFQKALIDAFEERKESLLVEVQAANEEARQERLARRVPLLRLESS